MSFAELVFSPLSLLKDKEAEKWFNLTATWGSVDQHWAC